MQKQPTMRSNSPLTQNQQFRAVALHERGLIYRNIVDKIGFEKSGYVDFLKTCPLTLPKRSPGGHKNLKTRNIKRINREQGSVSKLLFTLLRELDLSVSRKNRKACS